MAKHRLLLVATALVALAACGSDDATSSSTSAAFDASTRTLAGIVRDPAPVVDGTTLPSLTDPGEDVVFRADPGGLRAVYFGYTNCPDVCQIRMSQLAAVEARPGVPRATVVFVTSDPERDSGPVLKAWLAHFDPAFVGLTGTPAQVAAAQTAAGVPVARKQPSATPGVYLMDHPSAMLAFAPDGKGYTRYPYGTKIQEFVDDLRILVQRT